MRRLALVLALPMALVACTSSSPDDLYMHPELDAAHPATALADHALAAYFASDLWDGTSTCVAGEDGREPVALEFDEEARLMAKHVSLSPFAACGLIDGRWVDTDSRAPAHVIEVHGLSCADANHCTAFVRHSRWDMTGRDERYRMRFADGRWTIANQGAMR